MAVFKRERDRVTLPGFPGARQPKTRWAAGVRAWSRAACEFPAKAAHVSGLEGTAVASISEGSGLKLLAVRPMDVSAGHAVPPVSRKHMTPSLAFDKIRTAFVRMDAFYGRTVFDEWAVLGVDGARISVLAYEGPRAQTFAEQLRGDLVQLQRDNERERRDAGAFGFSRGAEGTAIDAYIVLGPNMYLVCNNTKESIADLALDPHWRQAQVPFADLAEVFRHHPVTTASAPA